MAQRGGRRPGAGRKLSPETVEFRQFWRDWFNSADGHRHLVARAKKSDAILAKLIDKCYPTPSEIDISFNRIPADFTFRCEIGTRGGPGAPPPVAVPEKRPRGRRD